MQEKQILDQKASDNEYLHRDFHGALAYALKYLDETYGPDAMREYLQQVGETYFAPLSAQLREAGLPALENHFQGVFEKENGVFTMSYQDDVLVLEVQQCPAIAHLKQTNQLFTERFCESTKVVNETICRNAGFHSSCEYEPGVGRCVQKFWKEK